MAINIVIASSNYFLEEATQTLLLCFMTPNLLVHSSWNSLPLLSACG